MTNSGKSTLISNKTMWDGNMHNGKMGTFTGKTARTRCWWFPQESAEPSCCECNSDWKETGPVKVTDILLWMSGSDLSPSAILLEPRMVNSNYVLFSWPVSQCSVRIRVLQILQPFLIHLPELFVVRFIIKTIDTLSLYLLFLGELHPGPPKLWRLHFEGIFFFCFTTGLLNPFSVKPKDRYSIAAF